MRLGLYLSVFVSFFFLSSCASTPRQLPSQPSITPGQRALMKAYQVREEALGEAIDVSESQRVYSVIVRHNPGRCGAPSQEIFVRGRWQRVALTGKSERVQITLDEWSELARQQPMSRKKMSGAWDERVWTSPGGVQWPVFEIVALEDGLMASLDVQRSSGESGISDGEWLIDRCTGAGSMSTP